MTLPAKDQTVFQSSHSSVDKLSLLRTPKLDEGTPEDKRAEIADYFTNTFDTYTRLFDCLADDVSDQVHDFLKRELDTASQAQEI